MKMFFYANFRTWDYTLGITRKVYSQIETFQKLGYEVVYCGYLEDGCAIFDNNGKIIVKKDYPISNKSIQHVIRRGMIIRLCTEYLKRNTDTFAFAYCRYHFFDKTYLSMLEIMHQKCNKVVIEAHSAPKFTDKISVMWFIGKRDAKWSKFADKYVDLIASMSDEPKLWGIDTIKIENAIDLSRIALRKQRKDDGIVNLIAVSFERDVHGYDRLIKGIANYYQCGGIRRLRFHIVGTVLNSTEKLIHSLNLDDICIKYGPLSGEQLDNVYDNADIAVGCLANHRIGSTYGSALKTKEYIAKGIPFIYGWNEKILEKFPYALKVELCEDPIDVEKLIEFYDSLDKEGLPERIRECLSEEDKWEFQMKKVVNAIK